MSAGGDLLTHFHGKSRVRVARRWVDANGFNNFKEWNVETRLESDMEAAYLNGDNTGMTATDTQKNSVYYVVKHDKPETAMGLALGVAKLMLDRYARVSGVRVR